MKKPSNESVLDSTKGLSTFEKAENIRFQNLANAPVLTGPEYGELNLDGCTVKEILGYKA